MSLKKFHDLTYTEKQRPENNPFLDDNLNQATDSALTSLNIHNQMTQQL